MLEKGATQRTEIQYFNLQLASLKKKRMGFFFKKTTLNQCHYMFPKGPVENRNVTERWDIPVWKSMHWLWPNVFKVGVKEMSKMSHQMESFSSVLLWARGAVPQLLWDHWSGSRLDNTHSQESKGLLPQRLSIHRCEEEEPFLPLCGLLHYTLLCLLQCHFPPLEIICDNSSSDIIIKPHSSHLTNTSCFLCCGGNLVFLTYWTRAPPPSSSPALSWNVVFPPALFCDIVWTLSSLSHLSCELILTTATAGTCTQTGGITIRPSLSSLFQQASSAHYLCWRVSRQGLITMEVERTPCVKTSPLS